MWHLEIMKDRQTDMRVFREVALPIKWKGLRRADVRGMPGGPYQDEADQRPRGRGHQGRGLLPPSPRRPAGWQGRGPGRDCQSTTSMKTKISGCEKKNLERKEIFFIESRCYLMFVWIFSWRYFMAWTAPYLSLKFSPLSVYMVYFCHLILAFLFSSPKKGID